jgi:hypothetical protein
VHARISGILQAYSKGLGISVLRRALRALIDYEIDCNRINLSGNYISLRNAYNNSVSFCAVGRDASCSKQTGKDDVVSIAGVRQDRARCHEATAGIAPSDEETAAYHARATRPAD